MIDMLDGLFIVSLIATAISAIKNALTPAIPDENFVNQKLYYQDIVNGVPLEQCRENIKNGRYKAPDDYREPHRDPVTKKIIIENRALYDEDSKKYSAYQVYEWMKNGKYNI